MRAHCLAAFRLELCNILVTQQQSSHLVHAHCEVSLCVRPCVKAYLTEDLLHRTRIILWCMLTA